MSLRIDTRHHTDMCRQLARLTGASFSTVVDLEVVKVIEKSASGVPAAKLANLRRSAGREGHTPAERQRLYKAKRGARGLSKQGFWMLAKMLGYNAKAPGYVAKAVPSDGQTYKNATALRRTLGGRYSVFVETSQPTLQAPYVNGPRAFQRAVDGRVKYFHRMVRTRVFDSVQKIARQYPGVRTF